MSSAMFEHLETQGGARHEGGRGAPARGGGSGAARAFTPDVLYGEVLL
ncbi:hypothetical protein ACFFUT_11725 [Pseudohalocynthiibacter aestuariivivens]|jgi:hypothetical protein|uniref:Uncharacterized protein n=1 Tax=Pseudohalocynthiibacter aestuariivivens TaxID=1591409 RepID=A0ABV5JG58_9RHOB|nr:MULTISPECIES: hypothetical protein [Pseudohalocynthiibacter]MBS9716217.1 hypothetical protein [Pseudohalocynthiibacter aestuariivivens]MCK0100976.1 hypothetical protein [Pseudohalocynthiibacter sp. F2068]